MNEQEYLADPTAGIDGSGRKVAYRYVPGRFCPRCGSALEYIVVEDRRGNRFRTVHRVRTRERRSADAVPVERTRKASKYVNKVVGHEYQHEYRYCCRRCGMLTERQASARAEAAPRPLPCDYYADGGDAQCRR